MQSGAGPILPHPHHKDGGIFDKGEEVFLKTTIVPCMEAQGGSFFRY